MKGQKVMGSAILFCSGQGGASLRRWHLSRDLNEVEESAI